MTFSPKSSLCGENAFMGVSHPLMLPYRIGQGERRPISQFEEVLSITHYPGSFSTPSTCLQKMRLPMVSTLTRRMR
uniref:Uncharacterized protein n=1 Tax=Picea glauca TaxID=3330 RepID=A0A124GP18_PICGL|nr:hypothetical protein ABT39_MTgene431 [Picea glauca]QHR86673.1 hypothetical protein Q903MT_gene677 [Picea sitchensis]